MDIKSSELPIPTPMPTQVCPIPISKSVNTSRSSSIISQNDEPKTKRKDLRELESQYHNLSRANQKLQEKFDSVQSKMNEYRKKAERLEKDLNNAKIICSKVSEEKDELQRQLTKNKEYTRKLEACITLKMPMPENSNTTTPQKLSQNEDIVKQLEQEKQKVEELIIIRDSNNEELLRLESEVHNLTIEKESFQKSNKELSAERVDLLDFIEELNSKIENLQKGYEEEISRLQDELSETVFY